MCVAKEEVPKNMASRKMEILINRLFMKNFIEVGI
jgi:hypothetical protein